MRLNNLLVFTLFTVFLNVTNVFSTTSTPTTSTTTTPIASQSDSCAQICSKTYTLHTYPQSEHLNACHRGCRFATLIELVTDGDSSGNSTRTACLNACAEAYNETEYYACSIGCNNNKVPLMNKHETEDDSDSSDNQILVSPFHMMRSLFQSIMTSGSQLVQRSSVSIYMSRSGDGESKVVVVQSEPEVVVHQYPDLMQAYDSESVTGNEERTTIDYKPRVDLSMWTNENPLLVHHPKQSENSWVNCFGYQSGVPRWILASVLFLAIFVLAWICCATTATAPEHHIRRRVGMGSDLKYLCLYDEPIKMVINDKPPSYQELQAGPLPLKVDIDSKIESN